MSGHKADTDRSRDVAQSGAAMPVMEIPEKLIRGGQSDRDTRKGGRGPYWRLENSGCRRLGRVHHGRQTTGLVATNTPTAYSVAAGFLKTSLRAFVSSANLCPHALTQS
jgi:hypothetical protein